VPAGAADFVDRVDEKLWVGSGLFQNRNSLFSTHGAVFGGKGVNCADWIALSNGAAGHSSTMVVGDKLVSQN